MENETLKAALKGAVASTLIVSLLIFWALFDISHQLKSDITLASSQPYLILLAPTFIVYFLYYLILGIHKGRPFKLALIVQSIIFITISTFVYWAISQNGIYLTAMYWGVGTFLFFSFASGLGAWVWSKPKTRNVNQ